MIPRRTENKRVHIVLLDEADVAPSIVIRVSEII